MISRIQQHEKNLSGNQQSSESILIKSGFQYKMTCIESSSRPINYEILKVAHLFRSFETHQILNLT